MLNASGVTLIAGTAAIIALIAIVAARLLSSAQKADGHVARAMALTPTPATPAPVTPFTAVRGEFAQRSAKPDDASPPGDVAAQQIFAQLNEYYAANISQGNTIFWASLLSMCIGFAIVFTGLVSARGNSVTAIVAAIAGFLSQFIAATFLVVLRSTQQQATAYAQSLAELHLRDVARAADRQNVELGLQLLNEMNGDRSNPANVTKAVIATGLIVKGSAIAPEAPPNSEDLPPKPAAERRSRSGIVTFDDAGTADRH